MKFPLTMVVLDDFERWPTFTTPAPYLEDVIRKIHRRELAGARALVTELQWEMMYQRHEDMMDGAK
jgi:hypothetical protein